MVHKPVPTFRAVKSEYLGRRDAEVREATLQGDRYLFRHFDSLMTRKLGRHHPGGHRGAHRRYRRALDAAERLHPHLGPMSYAVRKGYIDRSPVKALEAPPDQTPRHRVLTDDELRKVLTTARMLRLAGDQYGAIVELLIYTGQRRMQIGALARSMVDFDMATITWPAEV